LNWRSLYSKIEIIFADVKKVVITILAFLYLGLASGVVMNTHYCMGKLSSVEYGYNEHDHCDECGMAENDGCCNTELKVVKLQDSHELGKSNLLLPKSFTEFFNVGHIFAPDVTSDYKDFNFTYHSPPDRRANLVYLHTSILRI
jgi:hypothetical protein